MHIICSISIIAFMIFALPVLIWIWFEQLYEDYQNIEDYIKILSERSENPITDK